MRNEGVGARRAVPCGRREGVCWAWLCFSPVASRVSARQPSYFFLLRQKKVTKKKASHVRAASRSLALLAAFGTLANSLRSNSASVLIRTLLRCSARPNGGGIPLGSSASRTSPEGLVRCAHLAGGWVASFLTPLPSQRHGTPCHYDLNPHSSSWATTRVAPTPSPLTKARHAVPLRPHSSLLTSHHGQPQGLPLRPLPSQRHGTPCPYDLTPHSSLLIMGNHKGCPYALSPHKGTARRAPTTSLLTPTTSLLTPTTSLLTPTTSLLTPHSSLLIPHSSLLTPHSSLLTPHSSLLTPTTSLLTPHSSLLTLPG